MPMQSKSYYQSKSLKDSIIQNQFFIIDEYKNDDEKLREMHLIDKKKKN